MAASGPPTYGDGNQTQTAPDGQNGPLLWQRPWSITEMRAGAGNWSLAGDAGLLLHLQEFSQRIISRTHEMGKDVDELVHEAKLTNVRVNNVLNDFIMLANTQFVENRVYDEDVAQAENVDEEKKAEDKEQTREEREAQLIPRVTNALKLGIDVIDSAFEKLDTAVVDSDSEDEDNPYKAEPILEAKDPYFARSMPYLIGTPQFMEDDNVGLTEDISEDEEESDQGSISVSEDDKESDESETEYSSSEDSGEDGLKKPAKKERTKTKSSVAVDSDDSYSDEDMFNPKQSRAKKISDDESEEGSEADSVDTDEESDKPKVEEDDDEEDERQGTSKPKGRDFASELAARLGAAVPKPPKHAADNDDDADEWSDEQTQPRPRKDTAASRTSDTSKRSDGKTKKHKGKGKGKQSKSAVKNKHEDDLFGESMTDDDEDMFSAKGGGMFSSSAGLFDDDDDDEGGLFADIEKPKKKVVSQKSSKNAFNDESDEEDEIIKERNKSDSRRRTQSGKLIPKGAVSVMGQGGDFLSSEKENSDTSSHTVKKPASQSSSNTTNGGGGGLFDNNDDDDDLFGGSSAKTELAKKATSKTSSTSAAAKKKVELFNDDDDDDDGDLFGSLSAPAGRSKAMSNAGLTVEGYNEEKEVEDRRHEDEQRLKKAAPEKKLPPGAVSLFGSGANPMVAALKKKQQTAPSDSEDDDKNAWSDTGGSGASTPSASVSKAPWSTRSGSMFDDDEDDFLFSSTSKTIKGSNLPAVQTKGKTTGVGAKTSSKPADASLFGDFEGDDDEGDLFSATSKSSASKKPAGGISVFSSAGLLEDSGTKGADKGKTRAVTTNNKPKSGLSLFGDDGEDDDEPLFSGKSTAKSISAPIKTVTPQAPKIKSGLFEDPDNDFLFGSTAVSTGDLFSSEAPKVANTTAQNQPKKVTTATAPSKKSTPKSSSLFGGDEDEDDDGELFGASSTIKTSKVEVKPTTGVTKSESVDESMEPKEESTKPRKPAGAVSMFGGIDPAALLKKRRPSSVHEEDNKDEEDKKEENVEEVKPKKGEAPKPVAKSKPSSLFDDDDDLFAPKLATSRKIEGVTTDESVVDEEEEPEPVKPKKPAGAVSMFGGLDPAAALGKLKSPTSDIPEAPVRKAAVPSPETTSKPGKSDDGDKPKPPPNLFSGDDDDDDDLFGGPKNKVPPPVLAKSPPKSELQQAPLSPQTTKPRRPPGAVSMFGGVDPFAAMKKKSVSTEDAPEESSTATEEPPSFIDPLAVLASPVTSPTSKPKPLPSSPSVITRPTSRHGTIAPPISQISTSITTTLPTKIISPHKNSPLPGFNPAAMLPGAVHPSLKKVEKEESVDFDEPPEADTLSSAAKDRPKLNRRRPPSRKARRIAANSSGISFDDTMPTSPTTPMIQEVPDTLPELPSLDVAIPSPPASSENITSHANKNIDEKKSLENVGSPLDGDVKPKSMDLFGNDDLLSDMDTSNNRKPSSVSKLGALSDDTDDLFGSGVFSSSSSTKAAPKSTSKSASDDDLFASPSSAKSTKKADSGKVDVANTKPSLEDDDDLFSSMSKKSPKPNKPVLDDDNDDLFSSSSLSKSKSTTHKTPPGQSITSSVKNVEDDEDIFSTPSSKPKSNGLASVMDNDKDDDLFSTPAAKSSQKNVTSSSKSNDALTDDDGDLFSTPVGKSVPVKEKSAKNVTLADDEDIFVTDSKAISASTKSSAQADDGIKVQEEKQTRPKHAVTKEASILSDNTDIFSDVPSAPAPRETKKKSGPKKPAATDKKTVFKDDVDDIFADTSAAKVKPKKDSKKKAAASKHAVVTDDIFDDPLS